MNKSQFIEFVAKVAVEDWLDRRIMLPSIVIAQACKESAFGTSELAQNAKALFGIKLNGWTGESYLKKADEQRSDGSFITNPNTLWRKYGDWRESILDHSTYIAERKVGNQTNPNFKAIIGETNLLKAIAGLVGNENRLATADRCTNSDLKRYVLEGETVYPYATGLNYPQSLLDDYIIKYDLYKYDQITEVEGVETMPQRVVFLSAGHGGDNPGAVANGLKEKDINLNALLACKEVLEAHNVKVIASRTKDESDDVYEEVKEANASGAEIAVSFHANAGGGDGFEAFYYSTSEKGKKLASLGEKYVKELGQNSRGLKTGDHLYFVRKTTMTSVLFESFFLDNAKDKEIGDTIQEQKNFGVAYAKAILEYLGIEYKATSEKPAEKVGGKEKRYRVQVGYYSVRENAEKIKKELEGKGYQAIIKEELV